MIPVKRKITKEVLLDLILRVCKVKKNKQGVPELLQEAIDECASMEEILDLLFTTDFIKDEAILNAFDKRIDELERLESSR